MIVVDRITWLRVILRWHGSALQKVWRRVLVPQTITLVKLHLVIQAAFGWGHSHLHEFIAGDGERYGTPDPMYDSPGSITSENTRLTTALRKATLNYVYDFGDYWEHRIKIEKTLAPVPGLALPFCVGGACATPPEDCGGVPGYAEFVQAMADPDNPEHDAPSSTGSEELLHPILPVEICL